MSLESTGEVFSLDGFGAAPNSERLWNPHDRHFTLGAVRAQPLLRRPHPARRRPDADRRRPHRRVRGPRGHDALQRADEHVLPRRRHGGSRAGIRPRRSSRTAGCSSSPATASSRTGPGVPHAFEDASVNSLPRALQPGDEHVDEPDQRAADVAALPADVRPLGRAGHRRRPRHDDAHPDPGIVDVVDARHEPVRRAQRRHVPAEQDHEVRHVGGPRLRRRRSPTTRTAARPCST